MSALDGYRCTNRTQTMNLSLHTDAELVAMRTKSASERARILAAYSHTGPMLAGLQARVEQSWALTDCIDAELIARREDRAYLVAHRRRGAARATGCKQ